MTDGPYLLGIDFGTGGARVGIFDTEGTPLVFSERGYALKHPRPGWAEQDPDDWWRAAERALATLGGRPAAIGLSGQMHGLVALDYLDRILEPEFRHRIARIDDELRVEFDKARLHACGRRVILQRSDHVAALARTQADQADRTTRAPIELVTEQPTHDRQPQLQWRAIDLVHPVPLHPPRLFG